MKKVFAAFLVTLSIFLSFTIQAEAASGTFEQRLIIREATEVSKASEDDVYVVNTLFRFANSLAGVSFSDVRQYLVDQGYSFREEIGENKLATFHVECPISEVYFCFYPLDTSSTSTAFGDPDREMLSCIEYRRDDKWISVTDVLHTKEVQLIAGNKNDNPVNREISEIDILRIFYNYVIGGSISSDAISDVDISANYEDDKNSASPSAETTSSMPNFLDRVSNLNAFEYVERFMANWDECRYVYFKDEDNFDFSMNHYVMCLNEFPMPMVDCAGGFIIFDDAINIRCIENNFYESEDTVHRDMMKCLVMISVLEFNNAEQEMMSTLYKYGLEEYENVYQAAINIFNEIWDAIDSNGAFDKAAAGYDPLLYSGKSFDYYLSYRQSEKADDKDKNREWFSLNAIAKQESVN